jgi:hypothetical protein
LPAIIQMKFTTKNSVIAHCISLTTGTVFIFVVLLLTKWTNQMFGDTDSPLLITGFFFLFSLFVQFVIIKPTIDRWTKKKKMTKDRFILLWLLLAAASGLNFGLGFGIGFTDMLFNMLKGTIVFGLFHATDLMIYSKLTDKNYGWQQRA